MSFTHAARRAVAAAVLTTMAALCATPAALAATRAGTQAATRAAARATTSAVPRCTSAALVVWLGGSSGSVYSILFTNLGSQACTLRGFPGISAVGNHGNQIGRSAGWAGGTAHTVTLRPTETAYALVQIPSPARTCGPVWAYGLRVYPPNLTAAAYVPFPFLACSGNVAFLTVTQPVRWGYGP